MSWSQWHKLSNPKFTKKSIDKARGLIDLAASHDSHPGLKQDLDEAICQVFDIAIATLNIYQEHKRLWGVLDFTDQEVLMLNLLDQPEVINRLQMAKDILTRWQVAGSLTPDDLVKSADALKTWVDKTHPNATWKKEVPILHRLDNGTLVSGFIDLLLETPDQLIIINHKAFPGNQSELKKRSEEYFGQLAAYEKSIKEISSKPVVKILHYPVAGYMMIVNI